MSGGPIIAVNAVNNADEAMPPPTIEGLLMPIPHPTRQPEENVVPNENIVQPFCLSDHRDAVPRYATEVITMVPVLNGYVDKAITRALQAQQDQRYCPRLLPPQEEGVSSQTAQLVRQLDKDLSIFNNSSFAPFPPLHAHYFHNEGDFLFWTYLCLPGTNFLDHIPDSIQVAQLSYHRCLICGSFHPYSSAVCKTQKFALRSNLHPHYRLTGDHDRIFFLPRSRFPDPNLASYSYRHVHPGALFLFTAMPLEVENARREFKACYRCGIEHSLINPTGHCAYDSPTLADTIRDQVRSFGTSDLHSHDNPT
ncbi:hypothetical protein FRC14_006579 [Serendipita sp. 396]|nr:hypothetical protein FRC14_006579 [Serendipita sp. 396]KAG8779841.1 hypothetical protein FRC15_009908 [Serendipita sp. 397]KAG8796678.1 hypothetical protein FRC16_009531 [Serendipita sp. 398]KAG8822806.1 hypothetical protein FRC19_005209 [Serendipita sp. 401]KAG8866226.1 hypothetical protein FRC20_008934 [Serendipita sp. 405]KAG9052977.1 hypothetical protein FS842_008954 [Serendipita sp. 407]